LKAPGPYLLTPKCDDPLSVFAFKFNLRRYSEAYSIPLVQLLKLCGRGLNSSTFGLNVSTFCGIRRVHDFPPVYQTGGHGEERPNGLG
jgi:hypothetical protein